MFLKNPTKDRVFIIYKGTEYSLEPSEVKEVKDDVGNFWRDIHKFLQVVKAPEPATTETKSEENPKPRISRKQANRNPKVSITEENKDTQESSSIGPDTFAQDSTTNQE